MVPRCLANPSPGQDAVEPEPQGSKGKKQLQVPPKLLFFLEKEKHLRDRLKSYGLSNKGTKQVIQSKPNPRISITFQSVLVDPSSRPFSFCPYQKATNVSLEKMTMESKCMEHMILR